MLWDNFHLQTTYTQYHKQNQISHILVILIKLQAFKTQSLKYKVFVLQIENIDDGN